MEYQHTIAQETSIRGIGVHSGLEATLILKPAPANHGFSFCRVDLPGDPTVKATVDAVIGTDHGTTLGLEGGEVRTIEHLLAAFTGLGIDNVIIELDGPEVPVMDGSALPFIEKIRAAGGRTLDKPRESIILSRPVHVAESGMILTALPADEFRICCVIDYNHPLLQSQYLSLPITPDTFEKEVAPARTFGFYRDALTLMEKGLIKGTSLENTVVIGDDNIFTRGGLRFENECVRHKILDLIGDLSLLGRPLKALIIAIKSGHGINLQLAKKIQEVIND
ncbi:MAG: UDP-3-O-acyl-N-acetylglucosamine deacetylase [Candidatus Auribacterota bacterium]|nr:UDP-3-O-acyl-N-acetylglucosamine deacetylase [Candidatus Auribacterota bacterium]